MRLQNLFLDPDERVFVEAAEKVFDRVCNETGTAAERVFHADPAAKAAAWRDIRKNVLAIARLDGAAKTAAIRSQLAREVENLSTAHFYTNLDDNDRELLARHIFSSSREQQDRFYYFAMASGYALASVLEFIFFEGWDYNEDAKKSIRDVQRVFMDECKRQCELVLEVARAAEAGRELSDQQKEMGKTIVMLKELARRALAGEKLD